MTDPRPLVAMLVSVQAPYRLHLHRRIAREVPQVRLASLFTQGEGDQPWQRPHAPEINPVQFGPNHPLAEQTMARFWGREWRKGKRVIRWLEEHPPAAVLCLGYNDPGRIRVIRWCRRRRVPVFLMADSNVFGDKATGLRRVIKRALVSRVVGWVDGVMPCGSLGAAYFQKYGAGADRIIYMPYEPDYGLIAGLGEREIGAAMERHGLAPGRRRLVTCARLVPHKRVDLVVDAFRAVAAERPEWDLVVIGEGPERPALEARAGADLAGRVKWTGFIGDPAMVGAVYRACDVMVHAPEFEPWALVINEAAGAGLAIVATEVVGAAAELVREDVNGYTVKAGDLGSLVEAVRKATDPGRVDRLKAGSAGALADWKRRGDPVEGFRKAVRAAGVRGV